MKTVVRQYKLDGAAHELFAQVSADCMNDRMVVLKALVTPQPEPWRTLQRATLVGPAGATSGAASDKESPRISWFGMQIKLEESEAIAPGYALVVFQQLGV